MTATGGIRWGYWLLALYTIPIVVAMLRLRSPIHADSAPGATTPARPAT